MKHEGLLEQIHELNNNINTFKNRRRRIPFSFRNPNDYKLNDVLFNYTPHNNKIDLQRNCNNICIDNNINFNIINKNVNFGKVNLHNGYHSTKGNFKTSLKKSGSTFF
jgi:hypothetical protein